MHTTNFRRFTLNLDVAEIFKPVLVDRLIFSLIGIFIEAWDEKLKTTIKHRALNKEVSYRRLMRLELYKLQKHMMGEKEYEPFEALW